MFTWICPQCGREVPPSYTECPDCAAKAAAPAEAAPAVQAPPAPPASPAPQPVYAPPYAQPLQAPPAQRGMPTWLMTIVFALAFLGLGIGAYWTVNYLRSRPASRPVAAVENPASRPGAPLNPYQKFIEVAGVRFLEAPKDKTKTLVKVLLINHSEAEIVGLKGNVTVWGSTTRSEEDAQGTFAFTADLKPFEAKELTEPLVTKKQIYELADWQNLTTDVQITAPAAGDSPAR